MLHNNVHPGGPYELDVRCMLYCTNCKMLNPKLQLRYKLHLVVLDNTGHTKLLVLDNIALQFLRQPCFHPPTHTTSEILEPNVLRTALTNLVGKTYLFKIIIDKVNYQYEDDTFKVQKIITSPYMINEFDVSSYPKGGSNMFYPDFSNGSEDPEGSTLLTGSSSVDSKSNVKTPAKREGSPIESLEAAFYKSTANKHGPSDSIKKSPVGSIRANTCLIVVGDENGATIEATLPWYVNLSFGIKSINLEEDLCGAMVEVGDIEDIQEMQGNQIFATNQIRIRLTQIRCAVYGSVAEKLYQHRIASNANVFICVLKLW
ncbi:hypothetical protein F2Q68_00033321 [Brassica cretica]|uniref:Uncharacterized protein n=1 Tax=Brassica cretica TaxID=69181 RepID=A0A8S9G5E1_BRACR|nr:hypothetical protein F2Q68_00033321 [Brassica cretica]